MRENESINVRTAAISLEETAEIIAIVAEKE